MSAAEPKPVMVSCGTCAHWRPSKAFGGALGTTKGDCAMAETVAGLPCVTPTRALALDDADQHAVLRTDAVFGCTQWRRS